MKWSWRYGAMAGCLVLAAATAGSAGLDAARLAELAVARENLKQEGEVAIVMEPGGPVAELQFDEDEVGRGEYAVEVSADMQNWSDYITIPVSGGTARFPLTGLDGGPVFFRTRKIDPPAHDDTRVLVRFASELTAQQSLLLSNVRMMTAEAVVHTEEMREAGEQPIICYRCDMPAQEALDMLLASPEVDHAEPMQYYRHFATANDPQVVNQALWGMLSEAAHYTNRFGSRADQAWAAGYTGRPDVVVAVVDTGVDVAHPDLARNIWVNALEVPGNGIDDDGNGFIDDINGWDHNKDSGKLYGGSSDHSHGTHVAGTIAAVGGNALGVAGVTWNARILTSRFLDQNGSGSLLDAIEAIDYVTMLKRLGRANVVAFNHSWGGGGYSRFLHEAILRAAQADIVSVCAAGNSANNNDAHAQYPANYSTLVGTATVPAAPFEAVISVAAINIDGNKASFSCYGPETVDLGAPGQSILSTIGGGSYARYSGTSMAAPHVAGALALYRSYAGGSAARAVEHLLASVRATPVLASLVKTGGRLDVAALLAQAGTGSRNWAPLAADDRVSINYGGNPVNVLTNDVDYDGDTLTISAFTQGARGTVARAAGNANVLIYTPAGAPAGDVFFYRVADGRGASVTASVLVVPVNGGVRPIAIDDYFATRRDDPLPMNVRHNDRDPAGGALVIQRYSQPKNGAVRSLDGPGLWYMPDPGVHSITDRFTYVVANEMGHLATASVYIAVMNLAPTSAPVASPSLRDPYSTSTGRPTLEWLAVPGATGYEVRLIDTNRNATFTEKTSNLFFQVGTAGSPIPPQPHNTSYRWSARAINRFGHGPWAYFWTVRVQDQSTALPTGRITTVSPPSMSWEVSRTPTFEWRYDRTDYTSFRLEVYRDADFWNKGAPVIKVEGITGFRYTVPEHLKLDMDTRFLWRVYAVNAIGSGKWHNYGGEIFETRTTAPDVAPALVTPSSSAPNVPLAAVFSWNTVKGADRYEIEIARNDPGNVVRRHRVSDATFAIADADPLKPASTYYWRVRAINDEGGGPFSAHRMFTTAALAAPAPLNPIDNKTDVRLRPTFKWTSVMGAASYEIEISRDQPGQVVRGYPNTTFPDALTGVEFTIPAEAEPLRGSRQYYWRIRGKSGSHVGAWSPYAGFITRAE